MSGSTRKEWVTCGKNQVSCKPLYKSQTLVLSLDPQVQKPWNRIKLPKAPCRDSCRSRETVVFFVCFFFNSTHLWWPREATKHFSLWRNILPYKPRGVRNFQEELVENYIKQTFLFRGDRPQHIVACHIPSNVTSWLSPWTRSHCYKDFISGSIEFFF